MLLHGERAEVDKNDPILLQQQNKRYEIIATYDPENVFNINKTGLFFRILPRYTLLLPDKDLTTTRDCKKSKDQVSLAVCSNAT